jgi:peptidoglycan/LPS O-acetylase OafA/YrhL
MTFQKSAKRFFFAIPLGFVFGIICVWMASRDVPELFDFKNALFWTIVTNRLLIGILIAFAGAFTRFPVCGFCFPAWLRGIFCGAIVSLTLACGVLIEPNPEAWKYFWLTIASGAFYGLIIDVLATKFGGEGKKFLNN